MKKTSFRATRSVENQSEYNELKLGGVSWIVWCVVVCFATSNGLTRGEYPDPPVTPCTADDVCSNQLVKVCASGSNAGRQCESNADCSGSTCRAAWQERYVDPGGDMADCSNFRFGFAGADGVDLADPDGNGIVTGQDFTVQNEAAQGLLICLMGPEPWESAIGLCGCSDLDSNGLVDMRDVAAMMDLLGTTD